MPGTMTISGLSQGLLSGAKTIGPVTMSGINTVGSITDVTLSTGDNTFAVPVGAEGVAIFVSATNTAALTVRTSGNLLDTGMPINPAGPWMAFPFVSGTSSIVIHAAAGGAGVELTFI